MELSLLEQLEMYNQTDFYPFHMPGHKRNSRVDYIPVGIDITEIEGFDNLHHAEGVLKQAQERAARLYGAWESFFLVNGSTSGILASISAVVPCGGTLLMARNCHKAAYHGAFLRNLKVQYMYPEIIMPYGICGGINHNQVEEMLINNPDIQAVFLTSPTYEGMVSNIGKIADIVHRNGRILIVDEAHGAHLSIAREGFPEGAIRGGADLVIQSLHKTLPSMTQTAILHVQGNRVDKNKLRKYLQMYQTSSPSYVLMAGMDSCIRLLEREGPKLFKQYRANLDWFYEEVKNMRHLHVLKPQEVEGVSEVEQMDDSKICIFTTNVSVQKNAMAVESSDENRAGGLTGAKLYNLLLERYHLQMEMAAGNYVIAMTSLMDREEGFQRLAGALKELDSQLAESKVKDSSKCPLNALQVSITGRAEVVMTAAEAEEMAEEVISLDEGCGRISKEYRYVYPPGVPVLVPGERVTREIIELLNYYHSAGLNVLGQETKQQGEAVINVVKEE